MWNYIIPFVFYAVANLFQNTHALIIKFFASIFLLSYFWKSYKLKRYFSFTAVFIGLIIAILWVLLNSQNTQYGYTPKTIVDILFKTMNFIFIAPLMEELFIRGFLPRIFIDTKYTKVPVGKFNIPGFQSNLHNI